MPAVKLGPNQIVVDCDMSIDQWCQKRNRKRWYFYNLKKQGRAPELLNGRITQQADRAWERRERRRAQSEAARREAERKSEMARIAGRKGAQSELHYCNRKKRPA